MKTLTIDIQDSGGPIQVIVSSELDAVRLENYIRDANKALECWIEDEEDDYTDYTMRQGELGNPDRSR